MADQDQPAGQVANPNEPFRFSTTVTGQMPADQPPPQPAGLPKNFNLLDLNQQEPYLEEPDKLPNVTNEQLGQFALKAAPYAAATVAGIATGGLADYIGIPWYFALMARPVMAGLAGGAAEFGKQEAYKRNLFDTGAYAPTSGAEEWRRIREQAWSQTWPELIGAGISIPGEARLAKGGLPSSARRLYSRAVGKVADTAEETTPILRAGIKYSITPTEEGAAKAVKLAENFNTQIDQAIKGKPQWFPGKEWTTEVKDRFDKLRLAAQNTSTKSVENLKVVDDAERDFLINQGRVPVKRVPVYDAQGKFLRYRDLDRWKEPLADLRARAPSMSAERIQALKKGTWAEVRRLTNKSGKGTTIVGISDYTHPGFELDALEELGRAERNLLGTRYTGIHDINEAEGHMFELERAIQRKLEKEGRRAIFNPETVKHAWYGAGAGAAGGEAFGGPAGAAIGAAGGATLPFVLEAARDPRVLARRAFLRAQPGFARSTARGVIPGAIRTGEYLAEQPPEAIQDIDPSELPEDLRGGGRGGLVEPPSGRGGRGGGEPGRGVVAEYEGPAPPPPRAAYEPPIEQVPPRDRPVYERERPMKQRDQPLYGWRPEWASMLASEAQTGAKPLPLALLHTIVAMEGAGRAADQQNVAPNMVRSGKGAVGLMQVMPNMHGATAEELQDPQLNIMIGANYLRYLNNKPEYKNKPGLVLAAYNAGEEAVRKAGYKVYNLSPETQNYVGRGLRMWAQLALDPDSAAQFTTSIPERLR